MSRRVYIQGVCGTFMGGLARLAKESGHIVSGSDHGVYPPMSDQLTALGIELIDGFDPTNLDADFDDLVVGNVMTRDIEEVEVMLERRQPMQSGPAWLAAEILQDRPVLAIAGTHGKTTTSGMACHILDQAGFDPGFLVGGVPGNFDHSARLGREWFIIEADEYDSAFFDKRSKFIHYRPTVAVLNNLEFDHADIFRDIDDIIRQFHHLLKTIPRNGRLIVNADDPQLKTVLAQGVWTPLETFAINALPEAADWVLCENNHLYHRGEPAGTLAWDVPGDHNRSNALAAIAACHACGCPIESALTAMATFTLPRRRLDRLLDGEITVYDDFAHHPTAISATLNALKQRHPQRRVIALLERRSNSMRAGTHDATLGAALALADRSFVLDRVARDNVDHTDDSDHLLSMALNVIKRGDVVVTMSNGGFADVPARLVHALSTHAA
ncbi:UDP-N-acetylmuramate:L-alanyl-gamma-D-glutamyl-meso-diaminopimelate ligase [Gammaproteobacteria bacterium]|nr:UDP-N-acetylmuramate:L-alanyl-gamma-D-glutamyl-meso-diaminopimelate ligase [Gammaproteobacteria bacterium]